VKKTTIAAAAGMLAMPFAAVVCAAPAQASPCGPPSYGGSVMNVQQATSPACHACEVSADGQAMTPGGPCWDAVGAPLPQMPAACDKYQYSMDKETCLDNVARGFPPDDIRRP
jgi:hypothetical protein